MDPNNSISLELSKEYEVAGETSFSFRVNTNIPDKGICAIYGHSGSGKTTLLRCIAGLERASGHVKVGQQTWQDSTTYIPPHQRPIGFVFQESCLFPHLSVLGNLNYAVKRSSNPSESQIEMSHILELLGIEHLKKREANQLSGGERQRVAIARALLIQPKLLLMDEPLASLDYSRKREIIPYIKQIHSEFNIPILYVTHSVDEVTKLADHILLFDQGKLLNSGAVTQVLSSPESFSLFGEDFGTVINSKVIEKESEWGLVSIALGQEKLWIHDNGFKLKDDIRLRIKARDISIALNDNSASSILNRLPARVDQLIDHEDKTMKLVRLAVGNTFLISKITSKSAHLLSLEKGMSVCAQIKSVALID